MRYLECFAHGLAARTPICYVNLEPTAMNWCETDNSETPLDRAKDDS
jgi:hypothetical protein